MSVCVRAYMCVSFVLPISPTLPLHIVVTSESTSSPPYMQALLLSSEDIDDCTHKEPPQSDSDPLHSQDSSEELEANKTGDSYENPYLKPAKRVKITLLVRPNQ